MFKCLQPLRFYWKELDHSFDYRFLIIYIMYFHYYDIDLMTNSLGGSTQPVLYLLRNSLHNWLHLHILLFSTSITNVISISQWFFSSRYKKKLVTSLIPLSILDSRNGVMTISTLRYIFWDFSESHSFVSLNSYDMTLTNSCEPCHNIPHFLMTKWDLEVFKYIFHASYIWNLVNK